MTPRWRRPPPRRSSGCARPTGAALHAARRLLGLPWEPARGGEAVGAPGRAAAHPLPAHPPRHRGPRGRALRGVLARARGRRPAAACRSRSRGRAPCSTRRAPPSRVGDRANAPTGWRCGRATWSTATSSSRRRAPRSPSAARAAARSRSSAPLPCGAASRCPRSATRAGRHRWRDRLVDLHAELLAALADSCLERRRPRSAPPRAARRPVELDPLMRERAPHA